jgi:hypothetical protein
LDSQLELATLNYLETNRQIVPEQNVLYISSIFKWFVSDFGGRDGIVDFVLSHSQMKQVDSGYHNHMPISPFAINHSTGS